MAGYQEGGKYPCSNPSYLYLSAEAYLNSLDDGIRKKTYLYLSAEAYLNSLDDGIRKKTKYNQ